MNNNNFMQWYARTMVTFAMAGTFIIILKPAFTDWYGSIMSAAIMFFFVWFGFKIHYKEEAKIADLKHKSVTEKIGSLTVPPERRLESRYRSRDEAEIVMGMVGDLGADMRVDSDTGEFVISFPSSHGAAIEEAIIKKLNSGDY